MAIVITTNDASGQVSQTLEKGEALKTVQPEAKTAEKVEKTTEESVNSETSNEEADTSLDYLKKSNESNESDLEDDLDIEEADTDTEEQKGKKNGIQKRINKLTKEKAELKERLDRLEALALQANKPKEEEAKQEQVKELKEPVVGDFEKYDDYLKAKVQYEHNELLKADQAKKEQLTVEEEAKKITEKWQERTKEAREFYGEDKWDSLKNKKLPLDVNTRATLMQQENGPHVLYYLMHNEAEAIKLSQMTPLEQVAVLTKISVKLENHLKLNKSAEDKKISKAPAPVKPITSRTEGAASKDPSKMSFKEYKVWRAQGSK